MRLNDEEQAMLAGELGEVRRWAMGHQIAVGEFFDAADFVAVSQAHIMADTGSVIYANSVLGARSNFEGGPSALAAALTGRTPRYGYHLDEGRRATRRFELAASPRDLSEWGALGGIIGEACGSYWQVPVIERLEAIPGSDA